MGKNLLDLPDDILVLILSLCDAPSRQALDETHYRFCALIDGRGAEICRLAGFHIPPSSDIFCSTDWSSVLTYPDELVDVFPWALVDDDDGGHRARKVEGVFIEISPSSAPGSFHGWAPDSWLRECGCRGLVDLAECDVPLVILRNRRTSVSLAVTYIEEWNRFVHSSISGTAFGGENCLLPLEKEADLVKASLNVINGSASNAYSTRKSTRQITEMYSVEVSPHSVVDNLLLDFSIRIRHCLFLAKPVIRIDFK